jgi:hypothetical protein
MCIRNVKQKALMILEAQNILQTNFKIQRVL